MLVWVYVVLLLVPPVNNSSKVISNLVNLAIALIFALTLAGYPSFSLALWDGVIAVTGQGIKVELFLLGIAMVIINGQWQGQPLNSLMLLANLMGIVYLLASKDWLATVAAWELFNLALYLVAGFRGLQYFMVSALATTFLLLGSIIRRYWE
jgi:NADH:ubiquinone oxidoreductase subunit 2 (subunit N)